MMSEFFKTVSTVLIKSLDLTLQEFIIHWLAGSKNFGLWTLDFENFWMVGFWTLDFGLWTLKEMDFGLWVLDKNASSNLEIQFLECNFGDKNYISSVILVFLK